MSNEDKLQSSEKEQYWRTIQTVKLEEDFLLFDMTRNRTQIRYSDGGAFGGLKSSIRLEAGRLGKLNISISAAPYIKGRYAMVNPFERDQGYPIDADDLALPSRIAKFQKIKREPAESIQGLYLFVFASEEDLSLNGRMQALLQENAVLSENDPISLFRHLFLTLKFPTGSSFTARAFFDARQHMLLFRTFFPSDTGPLPNVGAITSPLPKTTGGGATESHSNADQGESRSEGFDLLLPFDLEKLKTIHAKFLFLPSVD
jgi:hypothetical protein